MLTGMGKACHTYNVLEEKGIRFKTFDEKRRVDAFLLWIESAAAHTFTNEYSYKSLIGFMEEDQ